MGKEYARHATAVRSLDYIGTAPNYLAKQRQSATAFALFGSGDASVPISIAHEWKRIVVKIRHDHISFNARFNWPIILIENLDNDILHAHVHARTLFTF